jgi:hypothetical protein
MRRIGMGIAVGFRIRIVGVGVGIGLGIGFEARRGIDDRSRTWSRLTHRRRRGNGLCHWFGGGGFVA